MQMCFILYGYFKLVRKSAKSDCTLRHVYVSVCPFVLMEELGFQWTDFFF